MATNGQFCWPPVGSSVAAYGQFGMAANIPSTGTVGDPYDNAMAEAINALFKTELIRARGPWRTAPQVELATLEWVWWRNNQRLHSELDYRTPTEAQQAHDARPETFLEATASQENT